ncbi:MAG: glutathione peroxidase [Hyphomicrobiaceae bacterium]
MPTRMLLLLTTALLLIAPSAAEPQTPRSAFEFNFQAIDGTALPLSAHTGKVLLVVNTASFCGFTHQYGGLQKLWETYEARGLVVIGVPSNDFGDQEPGTEGEIRAFCEGAYAITFPLTTKQRVRGPGAHPFYQWARGVLGERAAPRWNFHKYLVARDGRLIGGYTSTVAPQSEALVSAIEAELSKPAS